MPKISKAQMELLRKLAEGEIVEFRSGGFLLPHFVFAGTTEGVQGVTVKSLVKRGLVVQKSPALYYITDTGRSLVEQEAAKEVEA